MPFLRSHCDKLREIQRTFKSTSCFEATIDDAYLIASLHQEGGALHAAQHEQYMFRSDAEDMRMNA